ncbi:MAG: alpha/beta hydrolase [Mogibacterium sp.]|nr:alpha/beta hydrolase [Mogibacterium sp.]
MSVNEVYRKASNGEGQLASYYSLCEQPTAIVQLVHDMSEHAGRYADIAEAVNSVHFDYYANDIVGHGMSKQGHKGAFAMKDVTLEFLIEDIATLFDYATERSGHLPKVLVGIGIGASLACLYTAKYKDVDMLVLCGPLSKPNQRKIGKIVEGDEVWLSSDEAICEAYKKDADCGFPLEKRAAREIVRAHKSLFGKNGICQIPDIPVYIIAGKLDPLGKNGEAAHRMMEEFVTTGHSQVTYKLYNGFHDVLHDVARAELTRDLRAWADQNL